ncbi:hypothetical protein LguiA_023618 [Lonicera macranthoides]
MEVVEFVGNHTGLFDTRLSMSNDVMIGDNGEQGSLLNRRWLFKGILINAS